MTRSRLFGAVMAALALTAGLMAAGGVPAQAAVPARTIKIMTWNVCGNNGDCQYYEDPDGLIAAIRWHMLGHGAPMDAAIIQEFCSSFAKPLERELEEHYGSGWDVRFAPIKIKRGADPAAAPDKQCVRGRGDYGIAIAVPEENTWYGINYLPSVEGTEWRVAVCATVESWQVKLCNAHFSNGGEDSTGSIRAQQVTAYQEFVWPSRFRVIFGGDLNRTPPGSAASGGLTPLYNAFVECAQADQSSPRTGPGTYYTTTPHDNDATVKLDYLFTQPGIAHTCGVPGSPVASSDHRPMWMTVNLPAT
ncbi:endonuclease/exonuclease/phosphatase family protein [Nonomuraea sp. NPDC052116]|uniref:endonuclease/exonuclease/phosphatase family protein n=1 Tax=Nonomuraea sp. NPDC052116 TaxID=3155665 RepID=UPI0034318201